MKRVSYIYIALVFSLIIISISLTNCKKEENPVKFPKGTFPDTLINLSGINSAYDDYNIALYQICGSAPIVFSSNRKSSGGQFDLEQANISFTFDQTNGDFELFNGMTSDAFLTSLISKAETGGNDFGPFRQFSSLDGFEYFILSSENEAGDMDLFYLRNLPVYNNNIPTIEGPFPVNLLNSNFNDAYLCLDLNQDSAYYISDRDGSYDIYMLQRPAETELSTWFNSEYTSSVKVDSVNSTYNDKCPLVFKNIMIFASDRQLGLGGFDLYYSVFKNGNWSSPVNLGPKINSAGNEYRPVVGYHTYFDNYFMMFSSDRAGGKGGFDLYFTGIEFPE
ncbi:MAG TPA: hypothetical protein VMV77_12425 [Bacteroidales bacterium]|nr:hypothetical protein [Bacteroidales bacterium]